MHFMYKTPNMNMKRKLPIQRCGVPHNVQQESDS